MNGVSHILTPLPDADYVETGDVIIAVKVILYLTL